jgi:hypothetical protein
VNPAWNAHHDNVVEIGGGETEQSINLAKPSGVLPASESAVGIADREPAVARAQRE